MTQANPNMPSSKYHVIIVGAGLSGIAAAKTYLELDPSVSIIILDDNSSIGGVWSKSRVYPHLTAVQPAPLFEFPDLTMKEAIGVEDWSDISGEMIVEYLEKYAAMFGITEHCKFNTRVQRVDRDKDGQWQVFVQPVDRPSAETQEFRCDKLIMAAGFTSTPRLPKNLNTHAYTGTVFHAKEIAQRRSELLEDPAVQNITVVGGARSTWEIAGMFAREGKKVNWLIREDGAGPATMARMRPDGKNHMLQGKNVRAVSALMPTPYFPERWISRFLFGDKNWFGRWFNENFWKLPLKAELALMEKPNRKVLKPVSDRYVVSGNFTLSPPRRLCCIIFRSF